MSARRIHAMKFSGADDPLGEVVDRVERGDFDEALSLLADMDIPNLSSITRGRALAIETICAGASGSDRRARRRLRRELRRHRGDRDFIFSLGAQFSELRKLDFAEEVFRRLSRIEIEDPVVLFNLALVLERDDRHGEALDLYDRSLGKDPAFPPSHSGRAECLKRLGRLQDAAGAYRKYLELEPRDFDGWMFLAILESDLGRYDEAVRTYEKAREIEPDSPSLYYNWGITASRMKDQSMLLDCISRLQELALTDWRAPFLLGCLAEERGEIWKAWEAFRESLDRVLEEAEEEVSSQIAGCVLQFTHRQRLEDQAREVLEVLVRKDLSGEGILSALRENSGRSSSKATDFMVLLKGDVKERAPPEGGLGESGREEPLQYFRTYRVFAEDAGQAAQMALDFENRWGGEGAMVESVRKVQEQGEALLGPWHRSGRILFSLQGKPGSGLLTALREFFGKLFRIFRGTKP